MKRSVHSFVLACTLLLIGFCGSNAQAQTDTTVDEIPELVFQNPELVNGTALKEGAEYKFANVAPGLDGKIKLKKFSRNDISMQSVDLTGLGWDKAFQPQFGLPGNVQPNQDWYIDFELTFFKAGTTTREMVDRFTLTSLDVDGDGLSIMEYVIMEKASSVSYAPITYFGSSSSSTLILPTCPICGKQSAAVTCTACNGTGKIKKKKCATCQGVGKVYETCLHPWDGQDAVVQGPKDNFANIDTSATAVMATYVYNNKDIVNFRIGAKSGAYVSNAGIRLNSLWFKGFNLTPTGEFSVLPLKLHDLKAAKEDRNVVVRWATENESGVNHFVVERSTGGNAFTDIATVFANGSAHNTYQYKDATPAGSTTALYRIRMVDTSKQSSYSAVAAARLQKEDSAIATITTYPNPVQEQLHITMPGSWQGQAVSITVYNAAGLQLQSKQCASAAAMETVLISRLFKGTFVVTARTKTGTAQQTIYKN